MTAPILRVLIATTNHGKIVELRELLGDLPIELLTLGDVMPGKPPVDETGSTLEENALIKVRAAASTSPASMAPMVTIAEDSGLEVDALGGRPGVRSARFAKDDATDAENIRALLAALEHIQDDQRTARFRCVMALIDPWGKGEPVLVDGRCEGVIARSERGTGGFGYDPLFILADPSAAGLTMAELSAAQKNVLSHRAQAVSRMRPILASIIEQRMQRSADAGREPYRE